MQDPPLVSVIMIFLNEERFLEEAIQSVFQQTYTNWELLFVDDGSTDASTRLAQRYAAEDPDRVRYLEHQDHQNRGMSASRNLGIAHARGDFIATLDADDIWLPEKLERQVTAAKARPEAGMVFGPTCFWFSWTGDPDAKTNDWVTDLIFPPNSLVRQPDSLIATLRGAPPATCSILLRRSLLEKVGGWEESFRGLFEDQVFLAKVFANEAVYVSDECLAVEPQQVVPRRGESADRRIIAEAGVGAMPVVVVEPGVEMGGAVWGGKVGAGVGPFAEGSLDEALGLAVGAGGVGPCEAVANAQAAASLAEGAGAVTGAVVGEEASDAYAERAIVGHGGVEELHGRAAALIGQDLGEGDAGMVVDGDVDELPAGGARASGLVAGNAVAGALEAAESFDVEMEQFAGSVVLVAANGGGGVEIAETVESGATEEAADGGRRYADGSGDAAARPTLSAQGDDAVDDGLRGAPRAMTGTRRAIVETGFAFAAVAGEPTPGGALGDPAGRRGSRRGLPSEDASNQKGSTFRRQSGILMDVHSVSPGSLLFDNSSFPGPGPNEQRVERSHLARYRMQPDSSCYVALREGTFHPARQAYLNWLESYWAEQGLQESDAWEVLQEELARYRHPIRHRWSSQTRRFKDYVEWLLSASSVAGRKFKRAALNRGAGSIKADPNPVLVSDGHPSQRPRGLTTLTWASKGVDDVAVHLDAPDGPLLNGSGCSRNGSVRRWVEDGAVFYLQDVSSDKALVAAHTLDMVRVTIDLAGKLVPAF